jgi:hypothetical protein
MVPLEPATFALAILSIWRPLELNLKFREHAGRLVGVDRLIDLKETPWTCIGKFRPAALREACNWLDLNQATKARRSIRSRPLDGRLAAMRHATLYFWLSLAWLAILAAGLAFLWFW